MIVIMSELISLLRAKAIETHRLPSGGVLFRAGDAVTRMFEVVAGEVVLERVSETGARLILQRASAGCVVAEPSLFAEHYHCDAVAAEPTTVRAAPAAAIRKLLERDGATLARLAHHLAREVQIARQRAEILALSRLAHRLDAWLMMNQGALPPRGRWLAIAAELGVTPEALYRELAKRRKAHALNQLPT